MKKILLSLVALAAAASMSAQNLSIKVEDTSTLTKIPVDLYLKTDVEIAGYQCDIELPDGLTQDNFKKNKGQYITHAEEVFPYNADEEYYEGYDNIACESFVSASNNKALTISVSFGTSDTKYPVLASPEKIATVYFDASSLSDGTYEIKLVKSTVFPSADERIDQEDYTASFTIADGAVTKISAVEASKASSEIYNVNGQKLNGLQKGINIVGGKKVYVK